MVEISPKIKNWIFVIIGIILLILLVTLWNYWYFQTKISQIKIGKEKIEIPSPTETTIEKESLEKEIAKEKEICSTNFDLNKLNFEAPIWDSELSTMLPLLIGMQSFVENNERKCEYFQGKEKIHPNLSIKNCQRKYYFLKLVDELKKGMSCQNFIEECVKRNIPELDVEKENLEEATRIYCGILCQSYQQKTPRILGSEEILCDVEPSPKRDSIDYFDLKTNQLKTCWSGAADEIKFLIYVSTNNPSGCLTISNPKTSLMCQFYFDRILEKYLNEFKENYCRNLVESYYIPPQ